MIVLFPTKFIFDHNILLTAHENAGDLNYLNFMQDQQA